MAVATDTSASITGAGYARLEVLVSTDWVDAHKNDSDVVILESNEDVWLYDLGHIPGAINIDWHTDLNDSLECATLSLTTLKAALRRYRHELRMVEAGKPVEAAMGFVEV